MIPEHILQPEVQKFILDHEADDEKTLILKFNTVFDIPITIIANQIAGRRKALTKLPTFFSRSTIVYPHRLNIEQSSSEATAKFKATLIADLQQGKNNSVADLTAGFGVDSYFLSHYFDNVYSVEQSQELLEIAQHNFQQLGRSNIQFYASSAEDFLENSPVNFNWIYADPSRRDGNNKKVFRLGDCSPNVPELTDLIFKRTANLLIKTSPLLDIRQGILELKHVTKVFVVSVDNECKEVLFVCAQNAAEDPSITAVDIRGENQHSLSFSLSDEKNAVVEYAEPKTYLYEPTASLLKAGAFKYLAQYFNVFKLHANTHLYTADRLISDFPGRIFLIESAVKPDSKNIKLHFPEGKANVTTRNYPLSVAELKKKTGLKDGGEKFLIGFTSNARKHLVMASRL